MRYDILKNHSARMTRMFKDELGIRLKHMDFTRLMWARTEMGTFRYGPKTAAVLSDYDVISSCHTRYQMYEDTGCQEHLVDIANLMAIEYYMPSNRRIQFNKMNDILPCDYYWIPDLLNKYQDCGSTTMLSDIFMTCVSEFEDPSHPKSHWSLSTSNHHTQKKTK